MTLHRGYTHRNFADTDQPGSHMSQLHHIQRELGAEFVNFGPPPQEGGAQIVAEFGQYEAEYAAIRQRVGILHMPQRGVLRLTGEDRAEFLHRMLTCDVQHLKGGASRRAFQLNDKGRIVADLMLHHGDLDTWLETDVLDLSALNDLLEARLFSEDVTIEDFSPQRTKLVLYGPAALALLRALADDAAIADRMASGEMAGTHHVMPVDGVPISAYRLDDAGVMGLHLFVPTDAADAFYRKVLDASGFESGAETEPDADYAQRRRSTLRGRPVGWLAYNTARIEAGTPVFHVDFGQDSLPAETGIIEQAVDFKKGCYIGQEIVARMRDRGHPKRVLVGLKLQGDALPVAGAQVYEGEARQDEGGEDPALRSAQDGRGATEAGSRAAGSRLGEVAVIGGVTSSTRSPMLGQEPIAFAVVKWGRHKPGTPVRLSAEGAVVPGEVHALRFVGE